MMIVLQKDYDGFYGLNNGGFYGINNGTVSQNERNYHRKNPVALHDK
jgi:hypothetical protein